jgi:hypothetical protein
VCKQEQDKVAFAFLDVVVGNGDGASVKLNVYSAKLFSVRLIFKLFMNSLSTMAEFTSGSFGGCREEEITKVNLQ